MWWMSRHVERSSHGFKPVEAYDFFTPDRVLELLKSGNEMLVTLLWYTESSNVDMGHVVCVVTGTCM
jgi:hypothetical protein